MARGGLRDRSAGHRRRHRRGDDQRRHRRHAQPHVARLCVREQPGEWSSLRPYGVGGPDADHDRRRGRRRPERQLRVDAHAPQHNGRARCDRHDDAARDLGLLLRQLRRRDHRRSRRGDSGRRRPARHHAAAADPPAGAPDDAAGADDSQHRAGQRRCRHDVRQRRRQHSHRRYRQRLDRRRVRPRPHLRRPRPARPVERSHAESQHAVHRAARLLLQPAVPGSERYPALQHADLERGRPAHRWQVAARPARACELGRLPDHARLRRPGQADAGAQHVLRPGDRQRRLRGQRLHRRRRRERHDLRRGRQRHDPGRRVDRLHRAPVRLRRQPGRHGLRLRLRRRLRDRATGRGLPHRDR